MPHFGNNFALEVSQVIYAGGVVNRGIEIGKLQEQMTGFSLESEREKLRFMLVGYYLDLFKQKNLLRVYEQNIALTHQVLADIKAKHTEGVALGNDVTRYELQLSNLELTYTQIRNVITILNNNLVTILGLPNGTSVEPDTTLVSRFMPLDDVGYWTGQALLPFAPFAAE